MISLKNILLKEYSDKIIQSTIDRWKQEKADLDDKQAKAVINRFDQVKSGLSSKLDIINLSDELRQGNNYLDINKYSLMDMVNLLRSIPEKEDKVKKEAAKKFSQETGIPETNTRSYVARFFVNKENLKFASKEGNDQFSKEEVLNFIPKQLQRDEMFLDPRNWRWEQFEQMMDALYPSQAQVGDDENYATTDADKVYDKDGIEVYKGDDVNKCISYSQKVEKTGRKKYGWCVSQVGNTNYDYYRFEDRSPTFYFVFDRNKSSEPEHSPFQDKWHAFVVQVNKNNQDESYRVTSANNDSDTKAKSWEDISKIVPPETWSKIKGLKNIFTPIDLSAVERGRKFASGKNLSLDEFKELTTDEKVLYIQGKASKSQLKEDILSILPKFKIPLEGRSTTLANVAIDSGQKFPYSVLKDYEALAKRYAIFRFRHTDYSKEPIPLPYVKYLDDDAKQKYLDLYDGNLTFEYIEKYFGQKATENYVQEQVDKFEFLPQGALKYIKDPKQKQLYELYLKLIESWEYGENTNIDDELLSSTFEMPEQEIQPKAMTAKQWIQLNSGEQKAAINLAKQVNGKEKYSSLLYALPFIITDGDEDYILLPTDNSEYSYDNWVLLNKNNQTVETYKGDEYNIGEQPLSLGFPDIETDPRRVYPIKDLKKNNLNEGKYSFITEIKVSKPKSITERCKELYYKLYRSLEQGFDGNLKEWVEDNIIPATHEYWNDVEVNILDTFDDLSPEKLKQLYEFLLNYKSSIDEIKIKNPNYKNGILNPRLLKPNDILIDYNGDEVTLIKAVPWRDRNQLSKYDFGYNISEFEEKPNLYGIDNNTWLVAGKVNILGKDNISIWTYGDDGAYKKEETFEEQFIRERLMNRAGLK